MKPIKDILAQRDPKKGRYSKHEYQVFGYYLATTLKDLEHKSLYIKLAKEEERGRLEEALAFVKDSRTKSPGRLFMWKLAALRHPASGTTRDQKNMVLFKVDV